MKFLSLTIILSLIAILTAAEDHRPAFDKSPYKGTLWTQVNPWWPPNKPRQFYPLGGPNYARKIYPGNPVSYWKEAMEETRKRGMTGWQFELVASAPGYGYNFKSEILKAAEELGEDFKLMPFVGLFRQGDVELAIKQLNAQFDIFAKEWKEHPNIYRLSGRPVISVFTPFDYTPEEWARIIPQFEERFGPAVWLMNIWWKTYDVKSKPQQLRDYLPYFDGITAYANWGSQDELYRTVGEIMHKEFPQKIFEGSVHNTYSVHYYHGGVPTYLSEKYRKSWQTMADNNVDAVVMTNLFDHWENSIVLPCYEREDFLMRYAEYQMHGIFGKKFTPASAPELVLTNYIDIIPGRRAIRFEVIAFPLAPGVKERTMEFAVEVCDSAGNVLHTFPSQQITLDDLQSHVFELPLEKFIDQRAVIPRIVGTWQGKEWQSDYNPPTILDTSIRTSWMFWARSSRNRVPLKENEGWSLSGTLPGGTLNWNEANGCGFFRSMIMPADAIADKRLRIIRNGMEWQSYSAKNLNLGRPFLLPFPVAALNYYWLELETANGNRFQTFPVWVESGLRKGNVKLPIFLADKRVIQTSVEAVRVPFFQYPCQFDSGNMLLDVSGYNHHGRRQINGNVNYAYGSLGATGYYHYHNGNVGGAENPMFKRDPDGRGFLKFDAATKDFYIISGGTAFPYAATWELEFRVSEIGTPMTLIGTTNNQINIRLDKDGFLIASRGGVAEGIGGKAPSTKTTVSVKSKKPVSLARWQKIAVVYDLNKLSLYLDGVSQGSAAIAPDGDHEGITHLAVGAGLGMLHNPHSYFTGDIRNIRLYGRNLAPQEFLP